MVMTCDYIYYIIYYSEKNYSFLQLSKYFSTEMFILHIKHVKDYYIFRWILLFNLFYQVKFVIDPTFDYFFNIFLVTGQERNLVSSVHL